MTDVMPYVLWHVACLADVIAKLLADGIACIVEQGGRCYCHIIVCGRCYANQVYMLQLLCGRW